MAEPADIAADAATAGRIAAARSLVAPGEAPLADGPDSVAALLARGAAAHPDRPCLVFVDEDRGVRRVHTYAWLSARADRLARGMRSRLGLRPGDRVATLHHNHDDTVAVYLAAWRLGCCVVPINAGEDDARVRFVLENSGAGALFAHASQAERARAVAAGQPGPVRLVACGEPGGAAAPPEGFDDLAAVEAAGDAPDAAAPLPPPSRAAEALVVYTSGTTGPPKGVLLDQGNLLADAHAIAEWQGIDAATTMMCVLPIHHVNGIVVTLATPLRSGATTVVNRRFSASHFWRRIAAEGVAVVSVVPTLLQFLLEAAGDAPAPVVPGLRHIVCGAGPLTCELARDFEDRFRVRILHGYGLSETTCYSCFVPRDDSDEEHREALTAHGFPSIGCAVAANRMEVHDPDGRALGEGERGEIVVRGQNVMRGYWRRPEANAEAFAHGWFRSGDEGFWRRDRAGRAHFFISGRLKELIARGGVKISPFELDEVLMNLPGVKAGLAVGFDNKWYGEEVGAYLVPEPGAAPTEEEVLAACRARFPAFKCPKVVVFGAEVPVTSTGKYQRGRLKPLFAAWKDTQFRG
jgi:long-chain acyl-CoA synthetase